MNDFEEDEDGDIGTFFNVNALDKFWGDVYAIKHHAVNEHGIWKEASLDDHGEVDVEFSTSNKGYEDIGVEKVRFNAKLVGIADSKAQMNVTGDNELNKLGLKEEDLVKSSLRIKVANGTPARVKRSVLAKIKGRNAKTGEERTMEAMIYFANGVKSLFLSKETVIKLGILPTTFSTIANKNIK